MFSSITFDEYKLRAFVARRRRAAIVSDITSGHALGLLHRIGGRSNALVWEPNPNPVKTEPLPLAVFATVSTMI